MSEITPEECIAYFNPKGPLHKEYKDGNQFLRRTDDAVKWSRKFKPYWACFFDYFMSIDTCPKLRAKYSSWMFPHWARRAPCSSYLYTVEHHPQEGWWEVHVSARVHFIIKTDEDMLAFMKDSDAWVVEILGFDPHAELDAKHEAIRKERLAQQERENKAANNISLKDLDLW